MLSQLGSSVILAWVIVPIMGRSLTPSQEDVEGQMERSGGAPKMHILTPNIVNDTCIVAATVQESLWNLKLLPSPCRQVNHTLLLGAAIEVEVSKAIAVEASKICHYTLSLIQME